MQLLKKLFFTYLGSKFFVAGFLVFVLGSSFLALPEVSHAAQASPHRPLADPLCYPTGGISNQGGEIRFYGFTDCQNPDAYSLVDRITLEYYYRGSWYDIPPYDNVGVSCFECSGIFNPTSEIPYAYGPCESGDMYHLIEWIRATDGINSYTRQRTWGLSPVSKGCTFRPL